MRQSQSSVLPETGRRRESTRRHRGRPERRPLVERNAGWNARHRKTAVFVWLALVAIVFVAGQSIAAKNVPQYDPGQSGVAERGLARLHDHGPPPSEDVLIQAPGLG